MANTDLMQGTLDPRSRLMEMLLQPPPEEVVANAKMDPTAGNVGVGIGAALGDALQAYAKGLNPSSPQGNAVQQLMRRREVQAQRDATAQNQTRRQAFIGKQTAAREGLRSLDRNVAMTQQQSQFEAGQQLTRDIEADRIKRDEDLLKLRIAADDARAEKYAIDPKGAALSEDGRVLAQELFNAYALGGNPEISASIEDRLAAGDTPDKLIREFELKLRVIPNLADPDERHLLHMFEREVAQAYPVKTQDSDGGNFLGTDVRDVVRPAFGGLEDFYRAIGFGRTVNEDAIRKLTPEANRRFTGE